MSKEEITSLKLRKTTKETLSKELLEGETWDNALLRLLKERDTFKNSRDTGGIPRDTKGYQEKKEGIPEGYQGIPRDTSRDTTKTPAISLNCPVCRRPEKPEHLKEHPNKAWEVISKIAHPHLKGKYLQVCRDCRGETKE